MSETTALLALAAFFLISALLLLSNRGKTSPVQSALRALAAHTGGTYQRKPIGFGQVVEFDHGGRQFTFEVATGLAGPGDAMASYRSFRASATYQPIRPFELTLDPKVVREVSVRLQNTAAVQTVKGTPLIDDIYHVRTSDPQIAAALLSDVALMRQLAVVAKPTSRLAIGPHDAGASVAFSEEEEPVTADRLLAIRDMLAALLAALERNGLTYDRI